MGNPPDLQKEFSNDSVQDRGRWQGYYLVRGYHRGSSPYATVSDLPLEEAIALCEQTEPSRGLDNSAGDGTRNQTSYMQARLKTENWLRQNAEQAGVRIDKQNPVYFAFTKEPERFKQFISQNKPDTDIVLFEAGQLDLSNWSFTMDDHFFADPDDDASALSGYLNHPLHGKVLNAEQLLEAIEKYGYPEDEFTHNFEAQMWATRPTLLEGANSAVPTMESTAAPARNPAI